MSQVRSTPRYAHAEGYTNVCFSEDGQYIITCGSEGDVRIWNGIEDDDPLANCVGEKAFAIAQKGNKLYVGSDHNYVQILTFPQGELDHILTRFTAPVTTIDVSKDGNFVAAGSSDMNIHLVDISTGAVKYFSSHKAPVLHLAIDPKLEYLASSSCDGTVRVWKVEDQTVVKEWEGVIKPSNSFHNSESLCQISWEPLTGRLFAIPFSAEIKVMQRGTWNVMMTFSDSNSSQVYSLTSWSSSGVYLAGSTLTGNICVWNTLISTVASSSSDSSNTNICSLRWHPSNDTRQIVYCDAKGQLVLVENCYALPKTGLAEARSKETVAEGDNELQSNLVDLDLGNFEDDDEDGDLISLEKIKAGHTSFLDEEGSQKSNDEDDLLSLKSSTRGPMMPLVELQPTFQPTSTPAHLQRRFMVFNDFGYVKQTNTEEENVIDVDFHDASIHHAFRINNLLNHTMAALNSEALALACEKTEEASSKVVCRIFNSWDNSKEWNVDLPLNETVESIAVGSKWLAVATNLRFLRLFTLSGFQREIICLNGPILLMNASDCLLFIVYHSAMGLPGEQNLHFAVYQITYDVKALVTSCPLPLSPASTLKWAGFSDLMNPCMVDSDGVLKLFSNISGLWKPICMVDDQGKEASNHHFIIGVSEERQNIRSILCKGSYYPSTTPHPFICEIPWQIPVCEADADKGMLEEKFWRASIAKECLSEDDKNLPKDLLQTSLKLIALSIKARREMRVYEMCDISNLSTLTELASKYASKMNNTLLLDKLSELRDEQNERLAEQPAAMEFGERPVADSMYNDYGYESRKNVEKINAEEDQSQELFPERCSMDSNITQERGSVSLIAETKKKISLSDQRPILPSRKINPFRKSTQPENGLPASVSQTQASADTLVAEPKKDTSKLTFSEWFKLEKPNLMQEYPDLDTMSLAKCGLQKYNLLKKARESVLESDDSQVEQNTANGEKDTNLESGSKKRKTVEEEVEGSDVIEKKVQKKKPPHFKLQGFAFKKSS